MLVVHKPVGMISKDVSRWFTKRYGKVKLGHVGTLDPLASGVLPLLLGSATRLQDYLLDMPKTYECKIELGKKTNTLDCTGGVIATKDFSHITREIIQQTINTFVGKITQIPPLYSAVKVKGRPLYSYARSGETLDSSMDDLARIVEIHELKLLSFDEIGIGLRVTCSKGTYIRTLASDMVEAMGSYGTIIELTRTFASGVDLAQAWTLDKIEKTLELCHDGRDVLIPLEDMDCGLVRYHVKQPRMVIDLRDGKKIKLEDKDLLQKLIEPKQGTEYSETQGYGDKDILLLDDKGKAFGLGCIFSQSKTGPQSPVKVWNGEIFLKLKRGL